MSRYFNINNLSDPNLNAILKLAWPCSGFVCQQREKPDKTAIGIRLPKGDTNTYEILEPYPEYNKTDFLAFIEADGWNT